MSKVIDRFDGEYRFLSNFYPSPIEFGDFIAPTVEHAFQACKTCDLTERKAILMADTPAKAKKLGRAATLRNDWEASKIECMEFLLDRKFGIPALRVKLLETGDAELIEGNWWGDTFWGVCRGKGENHLGKLLMKIRNQIMESNNV